MKVTINLTPEQIAQIRGHVEEERTRPYTIKEAAQALGVSRETIRKQVASGAIPQIPDFYPVRIPAAEVDRLREGRKKETKK